MQPNAKTIRTGSVTAASVAATPRRIEPERRPCVAPTAAKFGCLRCVFTVNLDAAEKMATPHLAFSSANRRMRKFLRKDTTYSAIPYNSFRLLRSEQLIRAFAFRHHVLTIHDRPVRSRLPNFSPRSNSALDRPCRLRAAGNWKRICSARSLTRSLSVSLQAERVLTVLAGKPPSHWLQIRHSG